MNHRVVLMGYFFLSFFAHLPFFFFCFLKCWACITASFSWGTSSSPSRTFPLLGVPRLLVVVRAALRDVGLVKVPQVALVVRFSVAGHGVRVEDPEARDPLAPFGHLLPTGQESPFIPWTVLLRGSNSQSCGHEEAGGGASTKHGGIRNSAAHVRRSNRK